MLSNLFRNIFRDKRPPDADLLRAQDLLRRNLFRETLEAIAPVLSRHPDLPEALFIQGTACLELQQNDEGKRALERAVERAPNEPRYLFNLALAHWIDGNAARTVALCNEAVRISGFHAAHVLLANIEMSGEDYFRVLARLHAHVRPRTYLEIGVFRGASLRLVPATTQAIGVDPEPCLDEPPGPNQEVFAETSDVFFASHDVPAEFGGRPIDMAFIDGMHQFEFALRDFINIERNAHRGSVVLIHDCYPLDAQTAARERVTAFWSGDIWRLILILRKYRPDLMVHTISTPPTGLGLVCNLDPASTVLKDNLDAIVLEYLATDYGVLDGGKRAMLNACGNDWATIAGLLDARPRTN
jgi:hypothetical protein